jgi:hypothetical protein
VIAVRSRGNLFDLARVAEARAALENAIRCPGTGEAVGPDALVLNGTVLCPVCDGAAQVEWVDQRRVVAFHARPKGAHR